MEIVPDFAGCGLGAGVLLRGMQIIPSNMLPERDPEALQAFLEGCRETAREKGRFQIASISLAVKHIAPLAVLQSIYEPEELHFYVERPTDDEALAGAEAVVSATFSGAGRFGGVRDFAAEVLANTIAVGDLEAPFTGPHFFTAFTFDNEAGEDAVFPPATVFLPRWQVSRSGGRYGAVANVRIDPDAEIEPLVMRIWGAYQKFGAFEYDEVPAADHGAEGACRRADVSPGRYAEAVREALAEIRRGAFEKVVLARAVDLTRDVPWQPLHALNLLRERFGGCFTFSFGGAGDRSFIGATPERLLRIRDGRLTTEAIAGSTARGATAAEDAALGRDLLSSAKDLHEHGCVRESILSRLQRVGVSGKAEAEPRLLQLANVQHLYTSITAEVGEDAHLLDIAAELHPTPAVGGKPREKAVPRIAKLERLERGLYAGLVGWFNHLNEGELVVGIRSALIDGATARLYAGAGIVEGSDAEKETRETEMKLRAMLEVFG